MNSIMSSSLNRLKFNQIINILKKKSIFNSINQANQNRSFHLSFNQYGEPVILKMPAFSPTMTEGQIVKWNKKEGDKVSPGESLFEVQTDKAVMSFDTEEEGILAKILKTSESKTIIVGTAVGIIVGPADDWKNVKLPENQSVKPVKEIVSDVSASSVPAQSTNKNLMGPVAKMLISLYDIDQKEIQGTGPHGLVLKNDVQAFISKHKLNPKTKESTTSNQTSPPPSNQSSFQDEIEGPQFIDIELTSMRKVIAKRLVFSKTTIPHSYLNIKCDMNKLMKLRAEYMNENKIKVSINDFLVKAVALSLKLVPEMNVNSFGPSNSEYRQVNTVDISVAVATENGLITPIVPNADKLTVASISAKVKELADKAKAGKLQPIEFQGGTFTISNLGMFGVKEFTAIINPPQIGILAVGSSVKSFNENGSPETNCVCQLSFDQRAVDIYRAIKFLEYLKYFLANPNILLDKQQQSIVDF